MASRLGSGRILASRTREGKTQMRIFEENEMAEAEAWEKKS